MKPIKPIALQKEIDRCLKVIQGIYCETCFALDETEQYQVKVVVTRDKSEFIEFEPCEYDTAVEPTAETLKAEAVREFVNTMIGALESGFVDRNYCTMAELHRIMEHHNKDHFGVDEKNIVDDWDEGVAELCGLDMERYRAAMAKKESV